MCYLLRPDIIMWDCKWKQRGYFGMWRIAIAGML